MKPDNQKRLTVVDLWRTAALILMLIYHFLYTQASFGFFPWESFYSPGLNFMQQFICCSFILVSGVSSRLSRSNMRRGFIVIGCAAAVTVASCAAGNPIWFGILHFLGISMIIYGLAGKYIKRRVGGLWPALLIALFIAAKIWTNGAPPVDSKLLWPLGFTYPGFYSADYFPMLPWFFLFLLGTWMGGFLTDRIREGKWLWMRASVPGFLTWPGRHSLVIYILHQPVFYGLAYLRLLFFF